MITLTIDPWCENCEEFDPEVEREKFYGNNKLCKVVTNVTCKRRNRCHNIRQYLRNEMDDKGKE